MIRHIVLTRFVFVFIESSISEIYSGLAAVADRLPGASGFVGGRSDSPEQIERGYRHAFSIDFESWDALRDYADDPEHRALGAQLVANAIDGRDGLLVVDLDV